MELNKCPNCGHVIPSPAHFGMKASPKNYITAPIALSPGKKYARTFALLFYPPRFDREYGELPPCIVIASEEYPIGEKGYPFISGAKFYPNDLAKLVLAWENTMLAEIAFRAYVGNRLRPEVILHDRLRELYHSQDKREDLRHRLEVIHRNMVLCSNITEGEERQ